MREGDKRGLIDGVAMGETDLEASIGTGGVCRSWWAIFFGGRTGVLAGWCPVAGAGTAQALSVVGCEDAAGGAVIEGVEGWGGVDIDSEGGDGPGCARRGVRGSWRGLVAEWVKARGMPVDWGRGPGRGV